MATSQNLFDVRSNGLTVFIVASQAPDNGYTSGMFLASGSFSNVIISRAGSDNQVRAAAGTSGSKCILSVDDDTFYSIRLKFDNTKNYLSINNGTEDQQDVVATTYTGSPLNILNNAASAYGNKKIAEILIYSRVLDGSEIAQVEEYLKNRYNHY
jgi:hypothetical protein